MNFGKLLGVGKSFFGSDTAAEYRLHKRTCLPKFNEGRNPFAAKPATVPVQAPVAAAAMVAAAFGAVPASVSLSAPVLIGAPKVEEPVVKRAGLTIARAVAIAEKSKALKAALPYAFKPMPKAPLQPAAKAAAQPPIAPPATKPAKSGWTMRLNPFRPPEPVAEPVARQVELSLDSVKVVHNDLADAEVEIVPVKSRTETVAVPELPPARHAWEYLGENLLKSS